MGMYRNWLAPATCHPGSAIRENLTYFWQFAETTGLSFRKRGEFLGSILENKDH